MHCIYHNWLITFLVESNFKMFPKVDKIWLRYFSTLSISDIMKALRKSFGLGIWRRGGGGWNLWPTFETILPGLDIFFNSVVYKSSRLKYCSACPSSTCRWTLDILFPKERSRIRWITDLSTALLQVPKITKHEYLYIQTILTAAKIPSFFHYAQVVIISWKLHIQR